MLERIEIDPAVMMGKPVIRGTRIPVELIVRKLSEGATEADLLDAYPRLTVEDIRAALDLVLDKIERQVDRYKGKRNRGRTGAAPISEITQETITERQEPLIARRKKFTLVPMDELEAIEQMNLLGHEDFFIFYNADTNSINVLYKRRDGSYGIIEPELG